MNRAKELISLCTQYQVTVSSCESLTAGLFTSTLADIPGASAVLKGGLVTYFTEMKEILAHIDHSIVLNNGVVSKECAQAMAENTREITKADYCVSFTGNAGPSMMEDKPAGRVYCAIATKERTYHYMFQWLDVQRNEVRQNVVDKMIEYLLNVIEEEEKDGNRE